MKKNSKYIDISCVVQVLGCIYKNPSLLENEKYSFIQEDFPSTFHQIIFTAFYNLYQMGAKEISILSIEDYLANRLKQKAEFDINKGAEYILKASEIASELQFPYYYNRLKKMTLMRGYESLGIDLSDILDPDTFDTKKKQEQEDKFDNMSLEDIAKLIDDKIEDIVSKYAKGLTDNSSQIGEGLNELVESLKESPAFGYPMYGDYINTIVRGARLGKFYLRSAATGVGKSRSMVADACFFGCSQMYDSSQGKWISIGAPQPTLYLATEQQIDEIQTICLAFIAEVDENHILTGEYYVGEYERVQKAIQILKSSKIYFECLPDFSMEDIENTIKRHIREHGILYVCYDYIHSSAKILGEIGGKAGVKGLREDNVLLLLSNKLKEISVTYDVFILSSTQLNADYQTSETPDQNLLRGAKAIADKIDVGIILLEVTKEDKEKLTPFCNKNGIEMPNIKASFYKVRQGQYKGIYLWMSANRACARFNPIFATKWDYSIIDIPNIKIKVEEESAF